MKISVIIPTYNEIKDLQNCLESLGFQTENDFEIIVIDDGSKDGTLSILKNLKKVVKNFKFSRQDHKGAGAARNYGASLSVGKVLVFVDADMIFDKDFIKSLTAPIFGGLAKGTFSKEEYVANWENVWARCWNIQENWAPKRRHPASYPDTQPVFRAILKSEFVKVGGFTPGGYDDDWSLYKKLGYMAVNATGATFFHKNPDNLKEIYLHSKWVSKRKYKLGIFGIIYALLRVSLPVSLVTGVFKATVKRMPQFIVFKVVYDLGSFIGICNYLLTKKASK